MQRLSAGETFPVVWWIWWISCWCSCSLSPCCSILRHALDKIAEIKSLLEERRIGRSSSSSSEDRFSWCQISSSAALCVFAPQLLRWLEFTATATPPGRPWGAVSWWRCCSSRPWRSRCGLANLERGTAWYIWIQNFPCCSFPWPYSGLLGLMLNDISMS